MTQQKFDERAAHILLLGLFLVTILVANAEKWTLQWSVAIAFLSGILAFTVKGAAKHNGKTRASLGKEPLADNPLGLTVPAFYWFVGVIALDGDHKLLLVVLFFVTLNSMGERIGHR